MSHSDSSPRLGPVHSTQYPVHAKSEVMGQRRNPASLLNSHTKNKLHRPPSPSSTHTHFTVLSFPVYKPTSRQVITAGIPASEYPRNPNPRVIHSARIRSVVDTVCRTYPLCVFILFYFFVTKNNILHVLKEDESFHCSLSCLYLKLSK